MRDTSKKIKNMMSAKGLALLQSDPTYDLKSLAKVPQMAPIIWEVKKALELGVRPERLMGGSGEAYLLKDRNCHPLAVFKPTRVAQDKTLHRELGAYLLDHQNFARVPPIVIATFSDELFGRERKGTCQLFSGGGIRAAEMFPQSPESYSPSSVRRIAQLDIRLQNGDRHGANLLIEERELIPIDHQLVLHDLAEGVHLEWLEWPQAKTPFTTEEIEYIRAIDAEKDRLMILNDLALSRLSADLYYASTVFLQLSVNKGLSPFEIGSILTDGGKKSRFFDVLRQIKLNPLTEWKEFSETVKLEMKKLVEPIVQF